MPISSRRKPYRENTDLDFAPVWSRQVRYQVRILENLFPPVNEAQEQKPIGKIRTWQFLFFLHVFIVFFIFWMWAPPLIFWERVNTITIEQRILRAEIWDMHTNACTAGGGRPQHDILVFRGGKVVWNALRKKCWFSDFRCFFKQFFWSSELFFKNMICCWDLLKPRLLGASNYKKKQKTM